MVKGKPRFWKEGDISEVSVHRKCDKDRKTGVMGRNPHRGRVGRSMIKVAERDCWLVVDVCGQPIPRDRNRDI